MESYFEVMFWAQGNQQYKDASKKYQNMYSKIPHINLIEQSKGRGHPLQR